MIRTIFAGTWVLSIVYCFTCAYENNKTSILIFAITTTLFIFSILYKEYLNAKKSR